MFIVQAHRSMDTYIARLSLIIYYHSLFYSLGHGATIVTSYCDVRYHSSTWVTFLSTNSTIWDHNSTIWRHNSSTMMLNNMLWYCLVNMVFGKKYAWLQMVMWLGIDQWAWTMNIWHIIKHNILQTIFIIADIMPRTYECRDLKEISGDLVGGMIPRIRRVSVILPPTNIVLGFISYLSLFLDSFSGLHF